MRGRARCETSPPCLEPRSRLQNVIHEPERLYLAFEFAETDLKRHMDQSYDKLDPAHVKVWRRPLPPPFPASPAAAVCRRLRGLRVAAVRSPTRNSSCEASPFATRTGYSTEISNPRTFFWTCARIA